MQEFFDGLAEVYVRNEPLLIQDTTQAELDYIAARALEVEHARQAGSDGGVEDEAAAAAEEKELAQWAESTGEASSTGTGAPLVEDVVDESSEEEVEAVDPRSWGEGESCGGPAPASRSSPAGLRNPSRPRRGPCARQGPRRQGSW